jgi:hypothetical protein
MIRPESVLKEHENIDPQLERHSELAGAVYEAKALREKNETLVKENDDLRKTLDNYRGAFNDKGLECVSLRDQLESSKKQVASAIQSAQRSGWPISLSNIFQRQKDNQKFEQNVITELQTKLAESEHDIRSLQAENIKLRNRTTEQERRMHKQTAEFAQDLQDIRSKELLKATKLSDTEILRRWKALGFTVRQFISSHLPESVDGSTVQHLSQLEEFKWLPKMKDTLQIPLLCPTALESWIWHFLYIQIFDSHSEFWAGQIGKAFGIQCDQIRSQWIQTPPKSVP